MPHAYTCKPAFFIYSELWWVLLHQCFLVKTLDGLVADTSSCTCEFLCLNLALVFCVFIIHDNWATELFNEFFSSIVSRLCFCVMFYTLLTSDFQRNIAVCHVKRHQIARATINGSWPIMRCVTKVGVVLRSQWALSHLLLHHTFCLICLCVHDCC